MTDSGINSDLLMGVIVGGALTYAISDKKPSKDLKKEQQKILK